MATAIDLGDTMGNAARGLHLATMGSVWQAAVMGFAGIQRRDQALLVDPHLPTTWNAVSVPLLFRGARLRFDFRTCDDGLELGISVERAAVRLIFDGVEREFHSGRHIMRRVGDGAWQEAGQ
jgi:trehalose/maltose hydrolase-like predicted phosphorylase